MIQVHTLEYEISKPALPIVSARVTCQSIHVHSYSYSYEYTYKISLERLFLLLEDRLQSTSYR